MKDIRVPRKEIGKFCGALHRLGLHPIMVSREGSWWFGHRDRISISDSPIHWAEVTYNFDPIDDFGLGDEWIYWVEYGVPDPHVRPGFPKFRLRHKSVRSSIFGRATGFRWEGPEELGIKKRLNQDVSICEVLTMAGTIIRARPKKGCWTIHPVGLQGPLHGPNESVWAMYESIVKHLLAAVNTSAR